LDERKSLLQTLSLQKSFHQSKKHKERQAGRIRCGSAVGVPELIKTLYLTVKKYITILRQVASASVYRQEFFQVSDIFAHVRIDMSFVVRRNEERQSDIRLIVKLCLLEFGFCKVFRKWFSEYFIYSI
jgi:hypothetical protein